MIGVTSTTELSTTAIDGDNFDVFSSLRDGADGEKFVSGIGEVVADGAGQLDLVAVAGGGQSLTLLYLITTQKKTARRLILSFVEILVARRVLVVST